MTRSKAFQPPMKLRSRQPGSSRPSRAIKQLLPATGINRLRSASVSRTPDRRGEQRTRMLDIQHCNECRDIGRETSGRTCEIEVPKKRLKPSVAGGFM